MLIVAVADVARAEVATPSAPAAVFERTERAVSSWRTEAAAHLALSDRQLEVLKAPAPAVARCVKLNNYWCIKKAGWKGEIAADGEGHVAFASAVDGAAVAALLLKRYYVDFGRHTALAIVSHWAPAACGGIEGGASLSSLTTKGIAGTLRARWLAGHTRGFITSLAGKVAARRSVVSTRVSRPVAAPTIAVGLNITGRPTTLDALLAASPGAPPSRSMIGMPFGRPRDGSRVASLGCAGLNGGRIASYAAKAANGIIAGTDGDLGLFDADGAPTANLSAIMANMATVEIGPFQASHALIVEGIADAFRPDRNTAPR